MTLVSAASSNRAPLGPSLMHAAMLSMYPLLEKDGLQEAYVGLLLIHLGLVILVWPPPPKKTALHNSSRRMKKSTGIRLRSPWSRSPLFSLLIICVLHTIRAVVAPPARYPFLWDALMVSWSFLNFVEVFFCLYKTQLTK